MTTTDAPFPLALAPSSFGPDEDTSTPAADRGHADELLHEVGRMLTGDLAEGGGRWPRTTVFLLRAAVELELSAYWREVDPDVAAYPAEAQLIILSRPQHLGPLVGAGLSRAWHGLRRTALSPTPAICPPLEAMCSWLDAIRTAADALRGIDAGAHQRASA
jgi:hypothetical protein